MIALSAFQTYTGTKCKVGETAENLQLMRRIDELYLKRPLFESRKMAQDLPVSTAKCADHAVRLASLMRCWRDALTQFVAEHDLAIRRAGEGAGNLWRWPEARGKVISQDRGHAACGLVGRKTN